VERGSEFAIELRGGLCRQRPAQDRHVEKVRRRHGGRSDGRVIWVTGHAQGVEDNQTVRAEFATIVQNFPDEANLTGRRQLAVRIVRQGGRGGAGASCRPG